ncbi:hypothetical protein B0H11DRAFT_2250524 [Mycena galericulata]|nr:hypothetical protein B0H11DRAFT_2250524 [Mycena galericulata]
MSQVSIATNAAQRHPLAVRAAGFGLIALGGIVVGPAILVGVLNLIGFGAAGVSAGTLAAAIQAAIGNVAAGSLFAWAQAAAAGGIAVAPAAIQLLGAGVTALGVYLGSGTHRNNTHPETLPPPTSHTTLALREPTPEPETEPDNTTPIVSDEDAQAMLHDPSFASDMANGLAASLYLDRPSNDTGATEPETDPDNTTPFVSDEDAQAMLDDPAFAADMANGLAASLSLNRPSSDTGASSSR